ncbi:Cloroperoxidase [Lentithecium fluviatile CBS 122367]|uniref:Cloroperoxidase n=1 Tax=Lentithecium fluviatile CBS 122367 TaxID=1168545 RepID=A0A6G1JNJ6_9PLEO|nr:Cloroperoxidase [Lentithecium fluviatile CBS 122367]
MKLLVALLPLLGLTLAQASPQASFDDWHPAVSSDLRGPCPGLNALANHGLLPRDGKNLTLPNVVKGLAAINVTAETATILFGAAIRTSSDPTSGAFTLADLAKHGIIEHDGSLSREDTALPGGDKTTLNQEVYEDFLSHFEGTTEVSIKLAAQARWGRIQASKDANPQHRYNPSDRFNSYAETGVYFQTLMDPKKGTVPLAYLKTLFEEERFPCKEGWKPLNVVSGFGMAQLILQLALNTPDEANTVAGMNEVFQAQLP